jgi:hypothetical protein
MTPPSIVQCDGLIFFNAAFQAPNLFAPPTHYYTFGVAIAVRFRYCKLFDNKSRAGHPDAVLPFSFSMSSSATLLLRTPGNQETVKKNTPPWALQRISRLAPLRAGFDQQ